MIIKLKYYYIIIIIIIIWGVWEIETLKPALIYKEKKTILP